MDLETIKLNRFIYRNEATPVIENPVYMSANQNSLREVDFNKGSLPGKKDAREIVTGTIITACLIKSSDQDDRIEIGQNLQAAIGTSESTFPVLRAGAVDYLAAFFHGIMTYILTGQGNIYWGYVQQGEKYINLENGLVTQNLSSPLWTVTTIGTGKYRVNHDIGNMFYSAVANVALVGLSGPYMCMISAKDEDSFQINTYNSLGVAVDIEWNCIVFINPS